MDKLPGGQPPSCNRCAYYYVTHDANFRHGCRAFHFKSARQPMLDVIEASGQPCHHFQQKKSREA